MNNPALLNALQAKLDTLVGQSSGYVESLPGLVQKRLRALMKLQHQNEDLELEFRKQVLELEKKFQLLHQPLYDQRAKIIQGSVEPTDEECTLPGVEPIKIVEQDPELKGIPEFWLTAFKNHPMINETITEADEGCLKHLVDIKVKYLPDNPGFQLEFFFEPNDYFTNSSLLKTYYLSTDPEDAFAEMIYDHAEGSKIEWKSEKDLTVKIETKKQRHKGTKETRTVKKTVPCDSFFNFFKPLQPPSEEDEEDDLPEDFEEKIEMDYEMGEALKEKIIPRAIDWFTGKALEHELYDEDEEEWDEEEDEEEDEDDDDDASPSNAQGKPAADGEKPPECKQS